MTRPFENHFVHFVFFVAIDEVMRSRVFHSERNPQVQEPCG